MRAIRTWCIIRSRLAGSRGVGWEVGWGGGGGGGGGGVGGVVVGVARVWGWGRCGVGVARVCVLWLGAWGPWCQCCCQGLYGPWAWEVASMVASSGGWVARLGVPGGSHGAWWVLLLLGGGRPGGIGLVHAPLVVMGVELLGPVPAPPVIAAPSVVIILRGLWGVSWWGGAQQGCPWSRVPGCREWISHGNAILGKLSLYPGSSWGGGGAELCGLLWEGGSARRFGGGGGGALCVGSWRHMPLWIQGSGGQWPCGVCHSFCTFYGDIVAIGQLSVTEVRRMRGGTDSAFAICGPAPGLDMA